MLYKRRSPEEREAHREYLWVYGPAVLLVLAALFVALQFVDPAPPSRITMATGHPSGAYHAFGQRYRDILARDGVDLVLRPSAGSVENIALLESGEADVALVQGGTGTAARGDRLRSVASLFYEPLWLFHHRDHPITRLPDLAGLRIAIGPQGSGSRAIGLELLADNEMGEADLKLSDLGWEAAWAALEAGEVDAVLVVASPTSGNVRHALHLDTIRLASFERAEAYTRLHHFLSKLVLPEGVADMHRNLPRKDVTLLAPTANLVSTEDLHPALAVLLLEAATEIHADGGMFETPGEFPARRYLDYPLLPEARRFFQKGPSFLRRTLPFWAANLVDRLAVMLVPLVALVFPLIKVMPPLYRWRVRRRVYRWYKELRALEREIREGVEHAEIGAYVTRLDDITAEVRKVTIPWAYADELYQLRLHIQYVRDHLLGTGSSESAREAHPGLVRDPLDSTGGD